MIQNSHSWPNPSLYYDKAFPFLKPVAISGKPPQKLPCMPWSSIDEALFAAHLQTTLSALESSMRDQQVEAVIIQSGDNRLVFQDDQTLPFRTNPWFAWLVPASPAPGSLLELRPGHRPRLIFVAPDDFWHSPPQPPTESWAQHFELHLVPDAATALNILQCSAKTAAWIGETPPPSGNWQVNPEPLLEQLRQARCSKTGHELSCLRAATRTAVRGHLAAEQAFRNGASEFDIHLAFLAATRQNDQQLPYPPIIALNEHCATLHYQLRDTHPPRRPLSLLIDAGAAHGGYGSDITRTWAMAPGVFASLIEGMHDLQQGLCETVAPGIDWRELHLRGHHLIAQLLRDAGVLQMSAEAAVASGVSSAFMPHGLGHLLGLQVHDVGGLVATAGTEPIPRPDGHAALRLTRRLEAGMVVTVEPGLYFIDSLLDTLRAGPHAAAVNWTLVETLHSCGGIRIEDNVVVTASGHENLTRTAFAGASTGTGA
jgi:Xaa-Pro dipeptidase